jgi:hypothetical protein
MLFFVQSQDWIGIGSMDIGLYQRYLDEYVQEAIDRSNASKEGILNYLRNKQGPGFLSRHKNEKKQALEDAKRAFEEHRHWPVEITLSHLGVTVKLPESRREP